MSQLSHLDELEAEAIYIIREVAAECEKPVMLYSIGKDSSVMLHLAMKAFYPEKPPFPFLHIDTTWKFKDMIKFRDDTAKKLGIEMLVYTNEEGVKKGINPFDHGAAYTDIMKTQALKQALNKYGFTAAFGGEMRKSQEPRKEFSLSEIKHRHGILRTSAQRCGSFTTQKSIRAKAFVCSQFPTGQKRTYGSTFKGKKLTSFRFTLRQKDLLFTVTATLLWLMTIVFRSKREKYPN